MKRQRIDAVRIGPGAGVAGIALLALVATIHTHEARADVPATKVTVNGVPMAVHFNDGDSFRVLQGAKSGVRARLVGFNTLESHGPVHQWGTWHPRELYVMAKLATLHARRGEWACETDWNLDTYGRTLMRCPGLAEELIRLGLAHALSIDDQPAQASFLAAQKEAIAARRGLWSHGVPDFVLTSLHSTEEDVTGKGTYNRLVSTEDGHSVMWRHDTEYQECQNVCQTVYEPLDDLEALSVLQRVRADAGSQAVLAGVSDDDLGSILRDYARYRHVNRKIPVDRRDAVKKLLDGYAAQGWFGTDAGRAGSCMIHVNFKRRYGTQKASCLK